MFEALNEEFTADVGVSAAVGVSERFGGGVNDKVEEVTLFLDGGVGHVGSELLNSLDHVRLEVWETPANHSQQVQRR